MTWVRGSVRFLLVTVGIIAVTSLGIDASQYLTGANSALGILVDRATEGACPEGMVFIETGTEDFCIDAFEASPHSSCPITDTTKSNDTTVNLLDTSCQPQSVANVTPWRFVSLYEAQKLCARAGKRLPTNAEWHRASLTLNDTTSCVVNKTGVARTGSASCVSTDGVHDLVGNVWEWLDASIENGSINGRTLPADGYVQTVDSNGVVVKTGLEPSLDMGADYAWTDTEGSAAMIRGGFYSSGSDAGVFAQNLTVAFNIRTDGIGFRCVQAI